MSEITWRSPSGLPGGPLAGVKACATKGRRQLAPSPQPLPFHVDADADDAALQDDAGLLVGERAVLRARHRRVIVRVERVEQIELWRERDGVHLEVLADAEIDLVGPRRELGAGRDDWNLCRRDGEPRHDAGAGRPVALTAGGVVQRRGALPERAAAVRRVEAGAGGEHTVLQRRNAERLAGERLQ